MQFQLKSWWRMLLLLLVCLPTGTSDLWATSRFSDPEQSWIRHQPKFTEPWFSVVMMFYDSDGHDSFFLHDAVEEGHDGPAVYVDGKYVCSPDWELAWPAWDNKGNEHDLKDEISENEWWGSTYENEDCVIRFWNPWQDDHTEEDGKGHYRYRVTMYVYLKVWNVDATHTVKVKGKWKINSDKTYEEEMTWNVDKFPTVWSMPTAMMTDYKTVSLSGELNSNAQSSTSIGLYTQSITAPTEYYKDQTLFGKYQSIGRTNKNYSGIEAEFNREKYNVTKNLPVQYSTTVTHEGYVNNLGLKQDMIVYKWFTVPVPGFAYPKNVTVDTKNQWDKKVTVSWETVEKDDAGMALSTAGKWTIKNATANDKVLEENISYKSSSNNGKLSKDVILDGYETPYNLRVYLVPTNCTNTPEELSDSVVAVISPVWNFNNFTATEEDEGIKLNWNHNAFENASGNNPYTIVVQRSTDYDSNIPDSATWINVTNIDVKDPALYYGSYLDPNSNLASNKTYYYRLMTNVLGATHFSDVKSAKLGGSKIQSFVASQGTYSNIVKLQWSVKQVGADDTNFTVQRRPLGSTKESEWADIYTTAGTASTYSYDDITAQPGSYSDYKLIIWTTDGNKRSEDDTKTTDGFSLSSGLISGNITYGTGTAVQGAKVTLKQQDSDGEIASALRSVRLSGYGAGFRYDSDQPTLKELFGGDFSIQLYVNPDSTVMNSNAGRYQVVDVYNTFGLYLRYDESIRKYWLGMSLNGSEYDSKLDIAPNTWSHINLVHSKADRTTTVYVMESDIAKGEVLKSRPITDENDTPVKLVTEISEDAHCLSIGNNSEFSSTTYFNGYLDEFRFWTKALSGDDIEKNFNHPLVGDEKNLAIYYPFDEGLAKQTTAYDFSKKNGIGNGRHAKTVSPAYGSTTVPNENQLSLMAYTNTDGAYTIRGIGFSGEGTSYSVIPTLGIHEFSPSSRSRFVSMSSLNHSGVDFEDVSSFPVSGKVFYAGTDYPLEGANFYVDGNICAKDGQMITTNEKGEFTISVPIGDHFITVAKNGHVFADGGRYPADPNGVGVKHTFDREIKNMEFSDETLVNFTGRVVGGDIEGRKSLGFGLSQNNIGIVGMVLTPVNETPRMNVVKEVTETSYSYEINTETVPVASATHDIKSKSWRGAGADDCRKIFIRTDSLTGEFSAMLPPLEYKVDSIRVVKTGQEVGQSSIVDLSNPLIERSDSLLQNDSIEETYSYNTKLMLTYHSYPVFNVVQDDHNDGAFGLSTYKIKDDLGELTIDDIYSIDESGNPIYKYGGAIFDEYENYTFNINAYEEYVNSDGDLPVTFQVPLKNLVVTIDNALSSEQAVTSENVTYEGKEYSAGDVVGLKSNQLRLDSLGCATYQWTAGMPNISTPYTRTISISYNIGDCTHLWRDGGLTGIVLGDMPTGNNFVTSGPDMLQMILRDPPGSKSSAEWTSGTVTSESYFHQGTLTLDAYDTKKLHMGPKITTAAGACIWVETEVETIGEVDLGIRGQVDFKGGRKYLTTIENTKTISTSDAIEFVGAPGDIFIGSATNVIFGAANNVGFHRVGATDEVNLDVEESISTGLSFSTMFSYTQNYIENMLLPNFELMRNNMLKTVTQEVYDGYNSGSTKNEGTTPLYLTTLLPEDPNFGKDKTYLMVDPFDAKDGYQDSVQWCNSQMASWIKYLRFNEEEKVRAYENRENKDSVDYQNFSINSGTSVSNTYEKERYSEGTHIDFDLSVAAHLYIAIGGTVNGIGAEANVGGDIIPGYSLEYEKTVNDKTGFKYTLAEDGDDNALSVDVYDYGAYGPIFRTRGGQTSAPYEGRVVTKYYEPLGTTIMEPTMQIEVPHIEVDQSEVTDIPSGSTATYTLRLSNASETKELLYYRLGLAEETNPNGAMLFIDGAPVTDVRTVLIEPHETVTKTLLLKQSDQSILDYDRIGIVFASTSQYYPTYTWDVIADTAFISAHFVPSSSPVTLELSNTLMNTQTGTNLVLTMKDFDRNYRGLKAFRMQYKKQGATSWTQIHEYVLNEADKTDNNDLLPNNVSSVSYILPMSSFSDGDYLFRIVSASTYGNDEVKRYSEEIPLVKDLQSPTPIGIPEPSDGILDIGDELSVTFNETILKGELTSEANFKVTGVLNGAEIEHETALSMPATETAVAATEAEINLSGKDFALDMWVNLTQGAGTLLKHGNGTSKMTVGINDGGQLTVDIAGTTYTSENTVPTGKWAFLSLSMTADGKLNASIADDANTTTLFTDQATARYEGKGPLAVGKGIKGAIHELLLWDEAHDMTTALLDRSITKNPSTRHLIGYWKMNEGEGTTIRDYARNRHMTMPDETWYLNNENKAVTLDGQSYVSINASELPTNVADDYALEFWMRGGTQTGETQLLQMGDIALSLSADGTLLLTGKDAFNPATAKTLTTSAKKLTDNAWHHVALNVLRQGAAAVYVDGKRCLSTNSSNVGSINTNNLIVGARRVTDTALYIYDHPFSGQIDEVRVWNATMNGDQLTKNRKVRLTGEEDGLVAYYPFEKKTLDEGNQVITVGDAADLTGSGNEAQLLALDVVTPSALNYTDDAPALRTKPSETNVSFTFVASNEKVVINLDEDAATIDGCTLNFTVRNVRDENGNYSEPAVWSAFVNQKELEWQEDALSCEAGVTEGATFTATVINKSGTQQMWSLSGMPSWLEVSEEYGTTNPLDKTTVTFTVSPATPIGKYEETIYLRGNNDIETPLTINVTITGQVPEWSVNPGDYELSMNVIGRVEVQGLPMDDADDLVAAFIGEECRGVTHPAYIERYDSYFATINIYASSNDAGKQVTFRAYDASTGTLYPELLPDTITFASLKLTGRYEKPIVFTAQNKIEQSTDLKQGWNWLSFYVDINDEDPATVLDKVADDVLVIKSQGEGWLMCENGQWSGSLDSLKNDQMYAVQMRRDRTLRIVGQPVDPTAYPISLKSGWNWIGYYGRQVAGISDALADMSPEDGDILKGQNGIAYFDSYEWAGPLVMMEPGVGYMIYTPTARDFGYPTSALRAQKARKAQNNQGTQDVSATSTFSPVDYHNYSGNAIMAVRVMKSGQPVPQLELGAYVEGECRAADVTNENGLAFLTIPGDNQGTLNFLLAVGDEIVEAAEWFTYEADAVYGSPKNPVVIDLGNATSLSDELSVKSEVFNDTCYDLAGRRVSGQMINGRSANGKLPKGIYIINGEKKAVK